MLRFHSYRFDSYSATVPTFKLVVLALLIVLSLLPSVALALVDTDGDGVDDIREGIDETNASSSDSFIEHITGQTCVHWNGFLSEMTQIGELRNAGCSPMSLRLKLYGSDGSSQNIGTVSLDPAEEFDVVLNSLQGFSVGSYGSVCAELVSGDRDTLDFQSAAYLLSEQSYSSGFSSPRAPARTGVQYLGYNHYFPAVSAAELSNVVASYLQISNDDGSDARGDVVFLSSEGVELHRLENVEVPAKGRADVATHIATGDRIGLIQWIPESSNRAFRLIMNRYYYDATDFSSSVRNISSLAATLPSGFRRGAPFDTRGRFAVLELHNTRQVAVTVPISVFAADGTLTSSQPGSILIPAKGTRHVILSDYLANGLGNVRLGATSSNSIVASLFEYGISPEGRFSFASASTPSPGFGAAQTTTYNNFLGGCRLRLANLTSSAKSPTIRATRYDGTVLDLASSVSIPGNGAVEVDVCAGEEQAAYGEVRVVPANDETIVSDMVRTNRAASSEIRASAIGRSRCVADITLSAGVLSLVAESNTPGTITVTNNSSSVTAQNIRATLPGSWGDVTQDSSSCASLAPGDSCNLIFTPDTGVHAGQTVPIHGTNVPGVDKVITVSAPPTAPLSVVGSPLALLTNGATDTLTVTNDSTTVTATNISSNLTGTALDGNVTETGNTCASLAPLQSCTLTFTPGSTVVAETDFPIQGANTDVALAAIEIANGATTISASVSTLAVATNGVPRVITITNTGGNTATGVSYTPSPALPAGTTISPGSCGTIAPAATCTLTVTPGATPSAAAGNTNPTPITLSASGDNTNTLTPIINVLTYGSAYQSGYIFAIDDTTPDSGSIGGKVAALVDQSAGIIWSSNGAGGVANNAIYGISETSTTFTPDPAGGQVAGQTACNGGTDGACDTNNIYVYYQTTAVNAPINSSSYATGLCTAIISGYSDWYLPSICEAAFDEANSGTGCGTSGAPTTQNMQSNLVDNGNVGGLSGNYWTSSEYSAAPNVASYYQVFATGGGSFQDATNKNATMAVRCVRALTL